MNDEQIADIWMMFKSYLDKKHIEMAAEKFVDLMADYGVDDIIFKDLLGTDAALDTAISYYLDLDNNNNSYEED
jgi:hypothetical protein|tara:strand:+ start:869 stop:1090 length:222 start_codon:yes stop_codon:yes gene_type:complete